MNSLEASQEARNELELRAWNEWKRLCSIKKIQEYDGELYSALEKLVAASFCSFAKKIMDIKIDPKIIIQEFDVSMWQNKPIPKVDTSETPPSKTQEKINNDREFRLWTNNKLQTDYYQENQIGSSTYKDYIFFKVEKSLDAPLAVIRGKITGPLGYLRDLAKNYFLKNYPCYEREIQSEEGKMVRRLFFLSSKDEDAREEEQEEQEKPELTDCLMPHDSAMLILKLLDRREQLLLLAKSFGISTANEILCTALGCKSTVCATLMQKMLKKLRISEFVNNKEAINIAISMIIEQFKPEKSAEPFLLLLEQSEKE